MLSRLWVFFRGILISLVPLYQQMLHLLKDVSEAHPMPFLSSFSLPPDMVQFLGPSSASLLTIELPEVQGIAEASRPVRNHKRRQQENGLSKPALKRKEDLGVPQQRVHSCSSDMKPFLKVYRDFTEVPIVKPSLDPRVVEWKQIFQSQVRAATTFMGMMIPLKETIQWCKSQNLEWERRHLAFLYLKCQRIKLLESAGNSFPRKLTSFKREACWAVSPKCPLPMTCLSIRALWRSAHPKTRFQSLMIRMRTTKVRACTGRELLEGQRKRTGSATPTQSEVNRGSAESRRSGPSATSTKCVAADGERDEIDDIFASIDC